MTAITYEGLRERGFRLHSTDTNNVPHMVYRLSTKMDTALEIGPSVYGVREWVVWLRSDLAHSRARFCYLRTVFRMDQVEALVSAIMDEPLLIEEIDKDAFFEALERERADCLRRFAEYCKNERWSYIPG